MVPTALPRHRRLSLLSVLPAVYGVVVSRRPLVTVPALTLGDLLLWHWSLTAPHTILAIVAGLTLPPLLVASMWLVGLACVQLLARGIRVPLARVSGIRTSRARARSARRAAAGTNTVVATAAGIPTQRPAAARSTAPRPAQVPLASADRERPPRKLAA
jgi:hypothetical protein